MATGFTWACGCGRTNVVEFLLEMGVNVNAMPHGETGLHCAAYGGQLNIVKLLLERRSAPDIKDKTYDATPLGWALYGWANPPETKDGRYYEVVALLVAAGATVEPECLANEKVCSDPNMLAALRGERDIVTPNNQRSQTSATLGGSESGALAACTGFPNPRNHFS